MVAGAFGYVAVKKILPVVDEVLGALIICTSDGARGASHGGGSPVHNPADHCPACVTLAKVAFTAVLVLLAVIAFPLPIAGQRIPIRFRPLVPHLGLGGIGSRAPPLLA